MSDRPLEICWKATLEPSTPPARLLVPGALICVRGPPDRARTYVSYACGWRSVLSDHVKTVVEAAGRTSLRFDPSRTVSVDERAEAGALINRNNIATIADKIPRPARPSPAFRMVTRCSSG
jgi:hypothetical protein